MQTLYCKPTAPVKRGVLKIYRKATFGNIPCTCYIFSTELQNAEVSLNLLKCDSTTDTLPAIFEISQNKQRKLLRWNQFWA